MPRQRQDKELYKFPTARTQGVVATVIFHIIVGALLVIFGFKPPLPPPEEEGILVNFGYDDTGSGLLEPSSSASSPSGAPEQEEGFSEDVAEIMEEVSEATEEIREPEKENLTQDFEEAPVVEKKVEKPDPAEEARKKAEEEARAKAEAERIRQAEEAERLRKEQEAEQKRIEDSIRVVREQEQRRKDIMDRTRNALSNAQGSGTGTNQGNESGEGNKGVETGAAGVNRYGDGSGTGNEGFSYDLAGRTMVNQVKPIYDTQKDGIVVVKITVDSQGNVTRAEPGRPGSTTLEKYFLDSAREAALKTKFDRKPGANIQQGTITYHFILR